LCHTGKQFFGFPWEEFACSQKAPAAIAFPTCAYLQKKWENLVGHIFVPVPVSPAVPTDLPFEKCRHWRQRSQQQVVDKAGI